tara:strand:- start:8387 stop:10207 length:1821 start_codon:yes stop_codon:yes gene_type:complete
MLINIQEKLQNSLTLHKSGKTEEAIVLCREILQKAPKEPNTLQLLGAFMKAKGDYPEAEKYMCASLQADPKQAHVHNNLGNLYFELDRTDDALRSYKNATDLEEKYADAWFNRAIVEEKRGQIDTGLSLVAKAIKYAPNQAKYYNLLGLLYKRQEKFTEAVSAFEKAVTLQPAFIKAIHNLGTAYREVARLDEARQCFNHVLNTTPDQVETWEAIGSLHHSTEDFDRAIVAYQKLLLLQPENLKIHRVVNNMMWETGRHDGFLSSYITAMEKQPESVDIAAAYAEELALSGANDQAIEVIEQALTHQGEAPALYHRLAHLKLTAGQTEQARHILENLLKTVTDNDEYYTDYAQVLLECGEYTAALEQADLAEKINPDFQKIWAIKGDCWRLLGDDRYHWLFDFDKFVKPMVLEVPDGFTHIEEFNEALAGELDRLHISDVNPRDQTLIGGTQTIGDLYTNRTPVIQKLRQAVFEAALRYIKALPDDDTHPHLRRKTDLIKFAGAWSVRLRNAGFHVNHYHSKGWISGPYYVKLPAAVTADNKTAEKPGWVNFGASRFGPESDRTPRKIIQPQAGVQVFFPSYMWHGTNAFESSEIRMTAPCDIVPR